jgi:hypothetical protein
MNLGHSMVQRYTLTLQFAQDQVAPSLQSSSKVGSDRSEFWDGSVVWPASDTGDAVRLLLVSEGEPVSHSILTRALRGVPSFGAALLYGLFPSPAASSTKARVLLNMLPLNMVDCCRWGRLLLLQGQVVPTNRLSFSAPLSMMWDDIVTSVKSKSSKACAGLCSSGRVAVSCCSREGEGYPEGRCRGSANAHVTTSENGPYTQKYVFVCCKQALGTCMCGCTCTGICEFELLLQLLVTLQQAARATLTTQVLY